MAKKLRIPSIHDSKTYKAIYWVSEDPDNRSDAAAARKHRLKSAASLNHYRKTNKIDRSGIKVVV